MKTGQLSEKANCNVETIRYYEKIGLLPAPVRSASGYRNYEEMHLKRLVFIRRSRELDFTLEEIRGLLKMVDGGDYACGDINAMAMQHISDIRQKILYLKTLEKTLTQMASQCSGGTSPECPVVDILYGVAKH